MHAEILELLAPKDVCDLVRIDDDLLQPRSPEQDVAWLRSALELIAGRRTWETLALEAFDEMRDADALSYGARAEAEGAPPSSSVAAKLNGRWETIRKEHENSIETARTLLSQVNQQAPTAMAMAHDLKGEVDLLELPRTRPRTVASVESAIAMWRRADELHDEIKALISEAEEEAKQRRTEVRNYGLKAFERVFRRLMEDIPESRTFEAQLFRAIPDLVLCNKSELLKRIADPGTELDDVVIHAEAAAYFPSATAVPSQSVFVARLRPASAAMPAAVRALSAASEAQVKVAKSSSKGIESEQELKQIRDRGRQLVHLNDVALMWLSTYSATAEKDKSFAVVALGEGLLAAGKSKLEQRSYRLAIDLLLDAMRCLIEGGSLVSEAIVEEAIFSLIAAKAWPKYLGFRSPFEERKVQLAKWIEHPARMLLWLRDHGHLDIVASIWSDLEQGYVAEKFLDVVQGSLPSAVDLLSSCTAAALAAFHVKSDPDKALDQVKWLITPARPSERLLRHLDLIANELRDIEGASSTAARLRLRGQLSVLTEELAALDRSSPAPVDDISELLPQLIERLAGSLPTLEADPSIQLFVRELYPNERDTAIQVPLFVGNKGGAPLENVALSLSVEKADLGLRVGGQAQDEHFVGTLDPDAGDHVTFDVDVPRGLVKQVTEVKFRAVLRTGAKVTKDKEFTVALRPRDRRTTHSPYTTSGAVTGTHFIGRTKELHRLVGALTGDQEQTPLLVGIRRIGKTSLLKQMMEDQEINRRYIPIYWSVEDRPKSDTTVQFFIDLCKKISDSIPKERRQLITFSREDLRREPYSTFESFTDSLNRIGSGKRILLIIDEFDRLLQLVKDNTERIDSGAQPQEVFQPQVLGALRKVIMKGGALRLVLAGLPTILSAQYEDRLFGTLSAIHLHGFSEQEAAEVLDEGKDVFSVTREARERIFSATGNQPYLLQLLCHNLCSRIVFSGRDQVAPLDVETVIEDDLLPHESYFADYVSLIGEYEHLLRAVALAHREVMRTRSFVSASEVTRILQQQGYYVTVQHVKERLQQLSLTDRPLVVRAPNATDRFRLVIGMLGQHLIRAKSV